MDAGNAFMPEFMKDYNRRFEREAVNPHDAHRSLQPGQDLARIFTWQELRTLTRNLAVHFRRLTYLVEPTPKNLELGRRQVRVTVHETADGTVELFFDGTRLSCSVLEKKPFIDPGQIVENKRLGAVLSFIQDGQNLAEKGPFLNGPNISTADSGRSVRGHGRDGWLELPMLRVKDGGANALEPKLVDLGPAGGRAPARRVRWRHRQWRC